MVLIVSKPSDDPGAGGAHGHGVDGPPGRWAGAVLALIGGMALVMTGRAFADEPASTEAMVASGRELFARQWRPSDPRCHGGDGLGPVYNANSCLACHYLGGAGGSGPASRNVVLLNANPAAVQPSELARILHPGFRDSKSLVFHHHGVEQTRYVGWRQSIIHKIQKLTLRFPEGLRDRAKAAFTRRNPPPLFGAAVIDAIPDDDLIAAARRDDRFPEVKGRVHRMKGGRVGRFGWKAQVVSLHDFVLTACANELGLECPGHPQAPSPLHFEAKAAAPDLTAEECDALVAYVRGLPPPAPTASETRMRGVVEDGGSLFEAIGCAACHVPKLGSVAGIYSDLLLHDMGKSLSDGGSYYGNDSDSPNPPKGSEWRTPPLWGLRDSAPYLHDGRAASWRDAVAAHGGEAEATAKRFAELTEADRHRIALFLDSLGPPPAPRTIPPRPEGPAPPPMDPGRQASARLAVARNLERSGRLPAARDAYREVVRDDPNSDEGRAAAERLRALSAGGGSGRGSGLANQGGPAPSSGRPRAPSMLFAPPSPPSSGHAADPPGRADQ